MMLHQHKTASAVLMNMVYLSIEKLHLFQFTMKPIFNAQVLYCLEKATRDIFKMQLLQRSSSFMFPKTQSFSVALILLFLNRKL